MINSLNENLNLEESEIKFSVPLNLRRGSLKNDQVISIKSAIINLKKIALLTNLPDWSNLNILDYGCGVKFTQTLLQFNVKVGTYTGMDVYKEMVEYLAENVVETNFTYFRVPFKNEMYNKNGEELSPYSDLPGKISKFDLITLQSVFTHFNPKDFLALLKVLNRFASHNCKLFFTCFIDNKMDSNFEDKIENKPLLQAYYKESYVRELLIKSNWILLSSTPPSDRMQHQFVCVPQNT